MRFIFVILINVFLINFAKAEPITFSFSRDGVGYQQIPKPELLNLLPKDLLFITTESGREFSITISRFSRSYHGNLLASGTTFSGGFFSMVISSDGQIFGSLQEDLDAYRLDSEGGIPQATLRSLEPNFLPYDDGVLEPLEEPEPELIDETSLDEPSNSTTFSGQTVRPVFRDDIATVDVLIYYDENLDDHEEVLDYIVELGNHILQESRTDAEVRIVAAGSVQIPEDISNGDILEFIATEESIAQDRAFFKADLVHVIRATTDNTIKSGNCGVAYYTVKNGKADRDDNETVGVTEWNPYPGRNGYSCYDETFIHEIGHNMGLAHDTQQCNTGNCWNPAYNYSYGKLENGVFRTPMAYGSPSEKLTVFSSPDFDCSGYACGDAPTSFNPADNRRTLVNTRYLVSGYEGQTFSHESLQFWAYSERCRDDPLGTFEAINIKNSHSAPVNLRSVTFLRGDGSQYSERVFDQGEYTVEPGRNFGWGWCDGPVGQEVREGFFTYENPNTGALVEGQHILFDDNYSGTYSTIRAAASDGGSVEGHPSFTVRDDQDTTISFKPRAGYVLSGVTGTCKGRIQGNDFIVENDYGDCTVIAQFSPQQSTDDVFRVSIEEPKPGSTYSGIKNLRGWAVASSGIDKVEIYVDGSYQYDAPYGGQRGDVGNIFPEVENSSKSGFSLAINYNTFSAGKHSVTAKAISKGGSTKASSTEFSVTKFHKPFIKSQDEINLNASSCRVESDKISIIDALIDGKTYDLELQWRTPAQDFEIIEIR